MTTGLMVGALALVLAAFLSAIACRGRAPLAGRYVAPSLIAAAAVASCCVYFASSRGGGPAAKPRGGLSWSTGNFLAQPLRINLDGRLTGKGLTVVEGTLTAHPKGDERRLFESTGELYRPVDELARDARVLEINVAGLPPGDYVGSVSLSGLKPDGTRVGAAGPVPVDFELRDADPEGVALTSFHQ